MLQLKLNQSSSFLSLPGILKSGAILTRTSFNIGTVEGGFNRRNKYKRSEGNIVYHDTLRKYFKDTNASQLIAWNNGPFAKFLSSKRAIEKEGVFVVDGTYLTVPDNKNYEGAKYIPLDRHHRYVDVKKLSQEEAKKFKYSLCYKMVNLLHLPKNKDYFTFFGTQISGGATHDKVLGKALVDNFVTKIGKGKIKTLIAEAGFLDKDLITDFKKRYGTCLFNSTEEKYECIS